MGVLSRKDYKKGGTVVKDVMTAKPIALHTDDKVTKAAHCMIDNKVISDVRGGRVGGRKECFSLTERAHEICQ